MSSTEIIVVVFGLFIGYWLVSKLWPGGSDVPARTSWDQVLQVAPDATVEDIRAAYESLTSLYHADRAKCREIAAAYRQAMQLRGAQA
jgi:hypothetical protein